MQGLLSDAIGHHQSGRLDQAERLYRELLALNPHHADALQLLGVIAYQTGHYETSIELIRKAIAINANVAAYYSNLGNALQLQGKLDEAVAEYKQALALQPNDVDAQYNQGNALQRQGKMEEAITCYERALVLQPNHVDAQYNLGNALQSQGKMEDAITCYERALVLQPNYAKVYYSLGNVFLAKGQLDKAVAQYGHALALKPDDSEACNSLGSVLQLQGKQDEAIVCYERALASKPDNAEAHSNLGNVLQALGRVDEAVARYERAIAIKPDNAPALNNLGSALQLQGKQDEAIVCYERALAIKPDNAEAHSNLGSVLQLQGKVGEAITCYKRAIAIKPNNALAFNNLGSALQLQGKQDEAIAYYERALAINPDCPVAKFGLTIIQLLAADFASGLPNYEQRFLQNKPRTFSQPQWHGEPLNGTRILLHAEQGLGDTLQALRYLPMVQAAGGSLVLEVQAPLRRMAAQIPGITDLVIAGDPLPPFDWQCPLMSLPLAFGTTLDTIPAPTSYLSIPDEALRTANALSWPATGLRVGLAWAGNPSHHRDRYRSIPLSRLDPLLRLQGVHFFSLQMGPEAAQLATTPVPITDLSDAIHDMADTAALMAHLDLVIAVDTSVVHLAGALGKPVWVLLPIAPDWRWLLGRQDSPWYPTMRLFRQPKFGDWESVVEMVRAALTTHLAPLLSASVAFN
jgi:tetratricopeptide (TPR) repeat protein